MGACYNDSMGNAPLHRPVVTLATLYGAGGRIVGPQVAERLGVDFLGPDVPRVIAAATGLSEEAVMQVDDEPRSWGSRFAANIGRLPTLTGDSGGSIERLDAQENHLRGRIEELLARSRQTGAVVLGHAGMVVLQSVPWALHVHLRGPRDARARQAAALYGIEETSAAHRQKQEDFARRDHARRVYGVDVDDVSLYHLVLDSTQLTLETCVDLIAEAANARLRHPSTDRQTTAAHESGAG
jgi:cytidylate kinase